MPFAHNYYKNNMSQKDILKTKIEKILNEKLSIEESTKLLVELLVSHKSELKKAILDKIAEFNNHAKNPRNQTDIAKKMIQGTLAELSYLEQIVEFENL